jgi:tetratricopeptide (TPR) repeat protein
LSQCRRRCNSKSPRLTSRPITTTNKPRAGATGSVKALLAEALKHYQRGALGQAEAACRRALNLQPNEPDALNSLGHVLVGARRFDEAITALNAVLKLRPDALPAWRALGSAYRQIGNYPEAERCLRRALEVSPDSVQDWFHLGSLLGAANRDSEATAALLRVAELQPKLLPARLELAGLYARQDQLDEAAAQYRVILESSPSQPEALVGLAGVLDRQGDRSGAQASLRAALAARPDHAQAHFLLATRLLAQDRRSAEGQSLLRRALRLAPEQQGARAALATLLLDLDQGDEVDALVRAVAADPACPGSVLLSLATALLQRQCLDWAELCLREAERRQPGAGPVLARLAWLAQLRSPGDPGALETIEAALRAAPNEAEIHTLHSRLYVLRGDNRRAEALMRRTLAANPQNADVKNNLSFHLLGLGEFAAAWALADQRRNRRAMRGRVGDTIGATLQGDLSGERVLLIGEQGIGDQLIFLRFVPLLRQRPIGELIYRTEPRTIRLLSECGAPVDRMVPLDAPEPAADRVLLIGDLPAELYPFEASDLPLPPGEPCRRVYPEARRVFRELPPPLQLRSPPHQRERALARLAALGPPPYVGLTWRAGAVSHHRAWHFKSMREIDFTALGLALRDLPVTWVGLQRGASAGEVASRGAILGAPLHDFCDLGGDLVELLALLDCLDGYVGVSNTNVHMLASLGKTADVLVVAPPDWRWMADGFRSPWAPGFRIYRQAHNGDWSLALARLTSELQQRFGASAK